MHRIDAAGFAAGNLFTDGNPSTGTPATVVDAAWLNDLQENVAQLVEAGGIILSKGDYTQLLKVIVTKGLQGCYFNISAAGGTADAITGSYTPGITELINGMALYVRAGSANATTTPTFTPNSEAIAAKTIVKGAGSALAAGDIAGGGHWIELQYDAILDKWVLLNPLPSSSGVPAGAVAHFAAATAPAGWLKCNGAAVSRTAYAALFLVIGTAYGAGNGATTFNLPDLRGEFVRGLDDARGVDTGRVIGTAQADELKSHRHSVADRSGVEGGSYTSNPSGSGSTGMFTGYVGGSETRPRNVAMLACIKY